MDLEAPRAVSGPSLGQASSSLSDLSQGTQPRPDALCSSSKQRLGWLESMLAYHAGSLGSGIQSGSLNKQGVATHACNLGLREEKQEN